MCYHEYKTNIVEAGSKAKRRDEMRIESYRERAVRSRRRRERELKKTRFILMNAAIALVVILIVFVVAIIN